jgi:hypothetical protein
LKASRSEKAGAIGKGSGVAPMKSSFGSAAVTIEELTDVLI